MGIKSKYPKNLKGCYRRNSVAGCVFSILVIGSLDVLFSASCLAQEEQRVEDPSARTSPQPAADFPEKTGPDKDSAKPDQPETKEEKEKKRVPRGSFVVAPLPLSSPAIGSGIVPVLAYIFPFDTKDKISPPSVVGAVGLITDNGSRGFAFGGQLYLKEDRYRITAGFAHGNVDYNIYGTSAAAGVKLPLEQTGKAFFGEFLRRVWWKFFLGPRFLYGNSLLTVKTSESNVPIPPDIGLHTTLTALGVRLTRDTSLNRFYPTNGTFFTFTSDFFSKGLGSKYSFQSYRTAFDKYWSLGENRSLPTTPTSVPLAAILRSTATASTEPITNCADTRRVATSLVTRWQPNLSIGWYCRSGSASSPSEGLAPRSLEGLNCMGVEIFSLVAAVV
jgi:hypothetical protein